MLYMSLSYGGLNNGYFYNFNYLIKLPFLEQHLTLRLGLSAGKTLQGRRA